MGFILNLFILNCQVKNQWKVGGKYMESSWKVTWKVPGISWLASFIWLLAR